MQGLAETMLTLDMPGRICGPDMKPGQRVKLSPLGCAMLTTLLSFPQVPCPVLSLSYARLLYLFLVQLTEACFSGQKSKSL